MGSQASGPLPLGSECGSFPSLVPSLNLKNGYYFLPKKIKMLNDTLDIEYGGLISQSKKDYLALKAL